MARIRSVKPEFFQHERLYELGEQTGFGAYLRIAWLGLISNCDCRGVFEWRPLRLKVAIFPWDNIDMSRVLEVFAEERMVIRFEWEGKSYGWIPTFIQHQRPHLDEVKKGPQRPEPLMIAGYVRWTHPEKGCTTSQQMTGEDPERIRNVSGHDSERVSVSLSPDSGSLNPESGGTERTGATAPDPAPSSASPSPEPESEVGTKTDDVEREWREEAANAGKSPGHTRRIDRQAVALSIPEAIDRRRVFRVVFAEKEPPAFRFVAEDLSKWSARAKEAETRSANRWPTVDPETLPGPPPLSDEEREKVRQRLGLSTRESTSRSKADQLEALKK